MDKVVVTREYTRVKIGIVGAGNVGGTLGTRWASSGHEVVFGVRDPATSGRPPGAAIPVVSVPEAVAFGEVVVFAVPYTALEAAVKAAGEFCSKVIIDCTNPIAPDFSGLACNRNSASEEIARWSGSPMVVKCFNTVGFNIMSDPHFGDQAATMLYCGDDPAAKTVVAGLAADLGFDPVDAGPLQQAKWLESFAWLWISMALKYGQGREMAFVLNKRD